MLRGTFVKLSKFDAVNQVLCVSASGCLYPHPRILLGRTRVSEPRVTAKYASQLLSFAVPISSFNSLVRLGVGSFGYVFDPIHLNEATKTLNLYVLPPIYPNIITIHTLRGFSRRLLHGNLTMLTADIAEDKCKCNL